jgi:hypothetical protein
MEKKTVAIRFNEILKEEMGKAFALKPLPLDPDFALKHASSEDKNVNIKNEILACPKTGGIRMGAMDFAGSMMVQFGSIQPGNDYDFPVLGFTFAFASKFLIAVLDLHPVAKDKEYTEKYLAPLKSIAEKYAWIPEPLTDPAMRARREQYLVEYRDDYIAYDPGSAPLQHHFGEEWGERYLREFLFGA